MTIMTKFLAGSAGFAAIALATPSFAQYYGTPYGYQNNYAYGNSYNVTQSAAQRCSAAVQNRLSRRGGLQGILGAVLGAQTAGGRVLSVTQVNPRRDTVRVRGLATSGRSPYGVGAYGALAYNYQPDLSFRCDVDYRGYVRNVDINRR